MAEKSLIVCIEEMKGMAERLMPQTFPKVTFEEEQEIVILKQRVCIIDGYEVRFCFSKSEYETHFMESLQIEAVFVPFLPFALICKLGRAFLGSDNLSYIEFFRNNRKVYCWTIRTVEGRSMAPDKKTKPSIYEGFEFNILQPNSANL